MTHLAEAWQSYRQAKGKIPDLSPRQPTPEEQAWLDVNVVDSGSHPYVVALADRIHALAVERRLNEDAYAAIDRAREVLDYTERDYLRWPWPSLDTVMGGMAPGTLHYIVCPSKGGKTTLMRSATWEWIHQGRRIYYGGFELTEPVLRTMYAADVAGVNPGDVLSGAWRSFDHYADLRARMVTAFRAQEDPTGPMSRLRFAPFAKVDRAAVHRMMQDAHDWGADAVVIDHIDHVDGGTGRGGAWDVSVATNHLLLELAQSFGLRCLITSQTNSAGKLADVWRDHKPVRTEYVKMGGHKLEVATTMFGFYRPLARVTKEERAQVERGERAVWEFVWPGLNAFNVMGHRLYGERIGVKGYLGWDRGRTVEPTPDQRRDIEQYQHAIRTSR